MRASSVSSSARRAAAAVSARSRLRTAPSTATNNATRSIGLSSAVSLRHPGPGRPWSDAHAAPPTELLRGGGVSRSFASRARPADALPFQNIGDGSGETENDRVYVRSGGDDASSAASSSDSAQSSPPSKKLVRLSKRMSELDLCSRREADRLLAAGRVAVGGKNAGRTLGTKVAFDEADICVVEWPGDDAPAATTSIDGSSARDGSGAATASGFDWERLKGEAVVLHKPAGYVSGQPEHPAVQVPAVRLLTRSNLHLRDGVAEDDELRDMLADGILHFATRFGMQAQRGRDKNKRRDGGYFHEEDKTGRLSEDRDEDGNAQPPQLEATLSGYVPAGRLDQASSGLLVFTRSGVLAKKLVSSDSAVDKEYIAHVVRAQNLTREEVRAGLTRLPRPNRNLRPLLKGGFTLHLDDRPLKPVPEAEWLEPPDLRDAEAPPGILRLVLREGRKRQIRRMCREVLGLHCVDLERTRVGPVTLEGLPEGMWRPLREDEARSIFFAGKRERESS